MASSFMMGAGLALSVVSLAGGTQGIAEVLARRAEGGRSTRLATFGLGLAIFFDDYANTLLVGTTMRPLTDRMRISREKLAYLVDSTAAPVAGLAVVPGAPRRRDPCLPHDCSGQVQCGARPGRFRHEFTMDRGG